MTHVSRLETLPSQFATLQANAAAEGVRNMALLARGFADGSTRFDRAGEALFGGWLDGRLVGVGGITRELTAGVDAMRMRQFYVHPEARRSGVGRALAQAAIAQGLLHASMLTCNARASAAAPPFWEALGFTADARCGWTHVLPAESL